MSATTFFPVNCSQCFVKIYADFLILYELIDFKLYLKANLVEITRIFFLTISSFVPFFRFSFFEIVKKQSLRGQTVYFVNCRWILPQTENRFLVESAALQFAKFPYLIRFYISVVRNPLTCEVFTYCLRNPQIFAKSRIISFIRSLRNPQKH